MQHQQRPRMAVPQQHMAHGQHMAAQGQHMAAQGQHMAAQGQHMAGQGQHMAPAPRHMAPAQQQMAQASPQARKRLRMESLANENTGMMSLQREMMELKQENKRLRRDICKALPEVVHEMRDIVGQLQIFAKTLQSTCLQLNQTAQKMPQRDALNRRMVTPANRTPPKQQPKLVRKVGPGQPPIRTVKTIETNSSPMQQRKVTTPNKLNNNQHYTSTSPTVSASSPRFSPSSKQSPVQSPFSPNQSSGSPRQPRYPPSLPMEGANNNMPQVGSITSLQSSQQSPVPVQLNAGAAPPKQDIFELKPGSAVCVPIESWLTLKVQNGDTETKMVNSLMKLLFTEDELRTQAMKATRPGQKCLDQSKVDAIIWRCMEEFPGKTKAHVVQAISQKLQESRQNVSSPDNDLLPEDVMMVLDPPTTVGDPNQNGSGSSHEGSENGKNTSDNGRDVIMVKEDPGWR